MKFFSYNFMLNEVPNNKEVMCVANIMLNDVPNSNDATLVGKMCTSLQWVHNNSQWRLYSHNAEKQTYQR